MGITRGLRPGRDVRILLSEPKIVNQREPANKLTRDCADDVLFQINKAGEAATRSQSDRASRVTPTLLVVYVARENSAIFRRYVPFSRYKEPNRASPDAFPLSYALV
jgi:hypothetical protein